MRIYFNKIFYIRLTVILISLLFSSCVYFNTFYNAEKYFKEADRIRLEKSGKAIPLKAIDNYGKTIQKCRVLLSEFPEFNKRKDAYLMIIQSQYYLGNYKEANISLSEIDIHHHYHI